MTAANISLAPAYTPSDLDSIREIFREYAGTLSVDLSFQDFEAELAQLPGEYAEPRGMLVLARVDGEVAGCCALRPADTTDYPNAAEMKRLYVRKALHHRRSTPLTCWRGFIDTGGQMRHRHFNAAVRIKVMLDQVNVVSEPGQVLGSGQGDRKQLTAAFHANFSASPALRGGKS